MARILLQAPHFGVKLWRGQMRRQAFEVYVFPVDHIMPKAGEHGNEHAPITTAENKTTDVAHAPLQWEHIEKLLLVGRHVAENLHVDLARCCDWGCTANHVNMSFRIKCNRT